MSPRIRDYYTEKRQKSVPGPGAYSMSFADKTTVPSYKLGTETRKKVKKNTSPDPGAYKPSINYSVPKAPAFKMGLDSRT